MNISKVEQVDDELVAAFARLVPQLTANDPPPARDELVALLASDSATLLVARDGSGSIVGALSLTIYRVPTGLRSIIEDVIVDEGARGQGIGEALVRRALEMARAAGASGVALTSNSQRAAANRLYLRMGFARRDTNSYLYKF
ncbi:MAG TPA: GNAT family N-acetyltransferase [Anaerolineales bacterium]